MKPRHRHHLYIAPSSVLQFGIWSQTWVAGTIMVAAQYLHAGCLSVGVLTHDGGLAIGAFLMQVCVQAPGA